MITDDERSRLLQAQTDVRRGAFDEAAKGFRALIAARPGFIQPRRQLIEILRRNGRHQEALEHLRALYALQPEPDHEFELATLLLAMGFYEEGWRYFEARYLKPSGVKVPLATPEWRGEPVARLLVWDEQGAGDTLQFARFLPQLKRRGVEVHFFCKPPLCTLLAQLDVNIIPARGTVSVPDHDAWVMMYSLPNCIGLTLDQLPGPAPYLQAAPIATGKRIGLVGRGNPRHANDAYRSLTDWAWRELRALPDSLSLHPGDDLPLTDFAETAGVIAGLDLVITVDTSVAHLAGAMGKPCWVLLTCNQTDWRWLLDRDDSPWYPSVRLFRQRVAGDWTSVIEEVQAALAREEWRAGGAG